MIEDGVHLAGVLCKNTIGAKKSGGLVHVIWNEHGPEAAKNFLNGIQLVVNYWLLQVCCGVLALIVQGAGSLEDEM